MGKKGAKGSKGKPVVMTQAEFFSQSQDKQEPAIPVKQSKDNPTDWTAVFKGRHINCTLMFDLDPN